SAEFFDFLVQREPGRLSRNFEQHASGFPEIDRMKISAIDYWRDVVPKIDETLAPLKLFGLVLRSERNVMHRTGRDASHRGIRLTEEIYCSARRRVVRRDKSKSISEFINQTIAETLGEQSRSSFVTFQRGGHTVKTVNRMFCRNGAVGPPLDVCRRHACRYTDQLNHKSIRIKQSNNFFSETRSCSFSRYMLLFQTLHPIPN